MLRRRSRRGSPSRAIPQVLSFVRRTISGARRCLLPIRTLRWNLTIDGNRAALARPIRIAPDDRAFVDFYDRGNGIVARDVTGLTLQDVSLRNIANFAVIVAGS